MEKESEYEEKHVQLYVGKVAFDPHRLIYATIILMVALAVYNQEAESWSGTPFMDLVVVVFAPLLALSLAHAFSDALDVQIRTGKRLSAKERRHLLGIAVQYVAVGVPVVALGLVWLTVQQDPRAVVRVAEALGVASLFFWGAFAARRSGLPRGRQWLWATIYGLLGVGIILIELAFTH
ncbi:MAG: hypothetical protein VX748_05355 [Actinomycetota bacterium]|nr:hypothetical protein [Micrococcales bacterium]MEC8406086.1 hypothetical protein [Actinomycetota bacterium]MAK38307.1 hypothetical protein [Micrococcales bacterium]MEC8648249.1 hypothetical protein [Actinomycetota bacterium]MEC9129400.1 hypothetical protein [Actinomycetota bacterium]